jgi:hypothetical protein
LSAIGVTTEIGWYGRWNALSLMTQSWLPHDSAAASTIAISWFWETPELEWQMKERKPQRTPKISIFDAVQTPSEKRIEALTDAVFAVAMTLLILDIKLPELPSEISSHEFARAVVALWPKVGVFILSFVVLARAWDAHRYVLIFLFDTITR